MNNGSVAGAQSVPKSDFGTKPVWYHSPKKEKGRKWPTEEKWKTAYFHPYSKRKYSIEFRNSFSRRVFNFLSDTGLLLYTLFENYQLKVSHFTLIFVVRKGKKRSCFGFGHEFSACNKLSMRHVLASFQPLWSIFPWARGSKKPTTFERK